MKPKSLKVNLNRFFTVISLITLTFITSSCLTYTEITKEEFLTRESKDVVKITTLDGKQVNYSLQDLTVKDSVLIGNSKWHKDTILVSNIKSIEDITTSSWVYWTLGAVGAFLVVLTFFALTFAAVLGKMG